MYTELRIGAKDYRLRLATKQIVGLEKALGRSPIEMLVEIQNGKMPQITEAVTTLYYMLQNLHHGITLDKTYDLFDQYVEDGHNMFELIPVFIDVYRECGYIQKKDEDDEEDEEEDIVKN